MMGSIGSILLWCALLGINGGSAVSGLQGDGGFTFLTGLSIVATVVSVLMLGLNIKKRMETKRNEEEV